MTLRIYLAFLHAYPDMCHMLVKLSSSRANDVEVDTLHRHTGGKWLMGTCIRWVLPITSIPNA